MQLIYDILSAATGRVLLAGADEQRAGAWLVDTTDSDLSLGDARVMVSVALPGDVIRGDRIHVRVRALDPVAAVAVLDREIADQQTADRTHRYIDPSHHRIRDERPIDVLERLDHNIEDLMTDDELDAALGQGRR